MSVINLSYCTMKFLVGAHKFGVPFPKLQTFSETFRLYILTAVNMKKNSRNFCLFVYLRSYNDKSNFFVFRNCAVKPQVVLCENEPFLRKMLISLF